MTIVDTADIISVAPVVASVVDDKKPMNIDLSDSLFDYDMLLKDVDEGSTNTNKENEELFQGLFNNGNHDLNSISNISSSASESPQQHADSQRPKVMQWGPQDGNDAFSIVSVVLQHHEEAAPMKIVFGTMTVETAQQQHMLASNSSGDGNSVWITLAASVPPLKDIRSDTNQVKISVCLFDRNDPDLAVDTWDIGQFSYIEDDQMMACSTNNRKRALSCEPIEVAQKKHTFDAKSEQEQAQSVDVNSQLLKLLAPYDPLLTVSSGDAFAHGSRAHAWLSPSSSDSSSNSSVPVQTQSNYSTTPVFPLTVNHMMLQQGLLNSKRSHHHHHHQQQQQRQQQQQQQHLGHTIPASMAQKHDMYRMYPNMQHQQQPRHDPYLMHSNQSNFMSHAMNNYIHSMNNSNHNYNSSVLYNMTEHQRQAQQYHREQQHHQQQHQQYHHQQQQYQQQSLSSPYSTSSSSNVPRRASAPTTTSYTTTNSNSCALNKAHLKLNGDLMDMITNWSVPEWQSGRRLVHFWRRTTMGTDGNLSLVECGFEPMDQQLYQQQRMRDNVAAVAAAAAAAAAVSSHSPSTTTTTTTATTHGINIKSNPLTTGNRHGGTNNAAPIVISCIYWRERNDYFITSVDCIYLLESLIGIQFTVEEKNRIRRNLEGFRPLTVSKCKTECADFFKLIMSFPHPKPRNIEKDVKVFSWKTLPHALRKIIRKYTPSYITSTPLEPIHQQQQHGFSNTTATATTATAASTTTSSSSISSSTASHLHHSDNNNNKF